ncbi:MAG: DUF4055 domain-containing protein, partial [bacterium]
IYTQTVWTKVKVEGKEQWVAGEIITPTKRGESFDFIPFVFLSPKALNPCVERPPIADLVDVNVSHYCTSADLEHGRHFTALPTPWAIGFDVDKPLEIGSGTAWVTNNENAKAGMLEFNGDGLGSLERALEAKEKMMAALGARLLENQKASQEAAETVRLRHSGENSVLQSIAQTIGMGLTMALRWLADWAGANPDDVSVALNTDLFDVQMSPTEMAALMALWQGNAISKRALFFNLEKGELMPPGTTFETEQIEIAAGGSTGSGGL